MKHPNCLQVGLMWCFFMCMMWVQFLVMFDSDWGNETRARIHMSAAFHISLTACVADVGYGFVIVHTAAHICTHGCIAIPFAF